MIILMKTTVVVETVKRKINKQEIILSRQGTKGTNQLDFSAADPCLYFLYMQKSGDIN